MPAGLAIPGSLFSASSSHQVGQHQNLLKRKRGKHGPDSRISPMDQSAITEAIRTSTSRKGQPVFLPAVGMEFNSAKEAKDFYNLYSWEIGFGIRRGRSRRSLRRTRPYPAATTGDPEGVQALRPQLHALPRPQRRRRPPPRAPPRVPLLRLAPHAWGISGWKDFGVVTPGAARFHGGGHHATKQRVPDLSFVTVFSVPNSCGEFVHAGAVMSTDSELTAGEAPPVSISLFLAYADDPVDLGTKSASRPSFHVRGGAEVVVLFRKFGLNGTKDIAFNHDFQLTVNGVVPTCFLPKLCGESCSALRVRDDVLLIASEARAEQASKEHSAKAYDLVLVLISQLDRAASTELVTWRRNVNSIKPATEQPLVAWAMSMLWDSKGYRMLDDLTVFDPAAGTGRAQQPQHHVVSAFVIVSVTLDVSVSFDAHRVRGRVLKTVVPGSLLSSEEEKMDSYTAPMERDSFGVVAILARKDPRFFEVLPLALVMGQRTLVSNKPCTARKMSCWSLRQPECWTLMAGHGKLDMDASSSSCCTNKPWRTWGQRLLCGRTGTLVMPCCCRRVRRAFGMPGPGTSGVVLEDHGVLTQ